tara:strand:+ start:104 stop:553 length:450 start_codon:yes stop_codon:yes gene_type:complete
MIQGIKITKLNQIHDERGKVMTMIRKDSDIFKKFGEIYFSCSYPGVVKAWHLHEKMTLNYAVISGEIKFVLYDPREDSPTKGQFNEFILSTENYLLITVPPLIWNGFKCIGINQAIVANCSDIPHDSNEIQRIKPTDKLIPYDWKIEHK